MSFDQTIEMVLTIANSGHVGDVCTSIINLILALANSGRVRRRAAR